MVLNVVLVGSNPLPCYIQIAYLLNSKRDDHDLLATPDKYLFVYSEETQNYYENICYVLREEGLNIDSNNIKTVNLYKNSREGYKIEEEVKKSLQEIKLENKDDNLKEVIINFTGGTKVMSVYATNAVRSFCNQKENNIRYTEVYVDSVCHKINFNTKLNEKLISEDKIPKDNNDLRKYVYISIDNLIKLHYGRNCKIKFKSKYSSRKPNENKEYDSSLDDTIKELSKNIFCDKDKEYRDYIGYIRFNLDSNNLGYFNQIYKSKIDSIKSEIVSFGNQALLDKLYGLEFDEKDKKIYKKISEKSKEEGVQFFLNKTNEYINLKKEVDQNYNIDYIPKELNIIELAKENDLKNINIKEINSVLGGFWFEHYFYLALLKAREELKKEKDIDIDVGWSCEVKPKGKNFEIDIVASKGYSLYVFSLTIDDTQFISKNKFFEVVFRTNQMSGEFGKVTLVTFLSKDDKEINKFKDDLTSFSTSFYSDAQVWVNKDVNNFDELVKKIKGRLTE